MFTCGMAESRKEDIKLQGIEPEVFQQVTECSQESFSRSFVYTDLFICQSVCASYKMRFWTMPQKMHFRMVPHRTWCQSRCN
jgi:hypothetical protein